MTYILFVILLRTSDPAVIQADEEYATMDACFNRRDEIIEAIGRPIINYQAICVLKDSSITPKPQELLPYVPTPKHEMF